MPARTPLPHTIAASSSAPGRPSITEPSSLVADGSRRRVLPSLPPTPSGSLEGAPTTLQDAPQRGDEALTSAEASVMARGTGRLAGNAAVSGARARHGDRSAPMIRRLLALARHHTAGDPPARAGEQAARLFLYSTCGRGISAAPIERPRAVSPAAGSTHGGPREQRRQ